MVYDCGVVPLTRMLPRGKAPIAGAFASVIVLSPQAEFATAYTATLMDGSCEPDTSLPNSFSTADVAAGAPDKLN